MPIVPLDSPLRRFAGKRALLYGRVSTAVQETDGYSLTSQRKGGLAITSELDMPVVGEDFEQGSGQDWDIAGVISAIERGKRREYDVLVLKNISRLSRKRGKQAWLEHMLDQADVGILYWDESYEDSAAGRLQRGLMSEIAEFQLELTRELSMDGRYTKVEEFGRPVGNGQAPYGWTRVIDTSGARPRTVGYEHDEHESAVIRRLRELRTVSTQELADRFNAEGIPAPAKWRASAKRPYSGKWTRSGIWRLLTSPMTWGEYRYGQRQLVKRNGTRKIVHRPEEEIRTLQLPPILTRRECQEIQQGLLRRHPMLGRPRASIGAPPSDAETFTLAGLLSCGHCGGALSIQASRQPGRYRRYRCLRHAPAYSTRRGKPHCPLPAVLARGAPAQKRTDGIEDIIWRALSTVLQDPAMVREEIRRSREAAVDAAEHAARLAFLQRHIGQKEQALARATERWANAIDELDRSSFEATRESLKREIRSLRVELAELEQYQPEGIDEETEAELLAYLDEIRDGLEDATPEEQREVLLELRLRGTVTFDPDGPHRIGQGRFRIACHGVLDLEGVLGSPVRSILML
jgi:DNA invertase Pin-like site-specific DNA recombinase